MNTLQTTLPPTETAPPEASRLMIGVVAKDFPLYWQSPLAMRIFRGAIRSGLRRAGISNVDALALFGIGFILCTVKVPDPNPALRAIQETLRELEILEDCEIAWADSEEAEWRTVYPPNGAEPFKRFLTDINIDAAKEQLAQVARISEALLRIAEQHKEKRNDDGATGQ